MKIEKVKNKMGVSWDKWIIVICIVLFGYGLITMILFAVSDTTQSSIFFIFGVINWSIGLILLVGLYYRLMQYLNKLKKGK